MNNDTRKMAVELLAGWLTEIHQQNKAIRRKNKIITRLRCEITSGRDSGAIGITSNATTPVNIGGKTHLVTADVAKHIAATAFQRDKLSDQLIIMGGELTRERGEHEAELAACTSGVSAEDVEEHEQYVAGLQVEFNKHNTALHTLATAMNMKCGENVCDSVELALAAIDEFKACYEKTLSEWGEERRVFVAQVAQLESDHQDLVKRNAMLRERRDLPVDRIPAHDELTRLQGGTEVYRAIVKESYDRFNQYEMDVDSEAPIEHRNFMRRLKEIIHGGPFNVVMPPEPLRDGDLVRIEIPQAYERDEWKEALPSALRAVFDTDDKSPLPQAFDGCTCECHRTPGVMHIMPCCWPGKMGEFFTTTDNKPPPEFLMVTTAVQAVDELAAAESALGAWLSAAMDDPGTCAEMKRDITRWFTAIEGKYKDIAMKHRQRVESADERYPTAWAYESVCRALDTHRARADKAEARVQELKGKNSTMYSQLTERNVTLEKRIEEIQQSNSILHRRAQKYARQLNEVDEALKGARAKT